MHGMAGRHEDGHGFTDRARNAKQHGGEQADDYLQSFAELRPAKFGDENRRAEPERNSQEHGDASHAEASDGEGQRAEPHIGHRRWIPLSAEKELPEMELRAAEDREGHAKDKEKNREHKQDGTYTADPNEPFEGFFGSDGPQRPFSASGSRSRYMRFCSPRERRWKSLRDFLFC